MLGRKQEVSGICSNFVEMQFPTSERRAELAERVRAIKTTEDARSLFGGLEFSETTWLTQSWLDQEDIGQPLSAEERAKLREFHQYCAWEPGKFRRTCKDTLRGITRKLSLN